MKRLRSLKLLQSLKLLLQNNLLIIKNRNAYSRSDFLSPCARFRELSPCARFRELSPCAYFRELSPCQYMSGFASAYFSAVFTQRWVLLTDVGVLCYNYVIPKDCRTHKGLKRSFPIQLRAAPLKYIGLKSHDKKHCHGDNKACVSA